LALALTGLDGETRRGAILALGRAADPEATEAAIKPLTNLISGADPGGPTLAAAAARTLDALGRRDKAVAAVRVGLARRDPARRRAALAALAEIDAPAVAAPLVVELGRGGDEAPRVAAALARLAATNPAARDALLTATRSTAPSLQAAALRALAAGGP